MVLQLFDFELNLRAEITIYSSLQMGRSYSGVGKFELHSHPNAPNINLIEEDYIIMPVGKPNKAFLIEDIEVDSGKFVARGCQLKGLAKRRVCVPPLNLPTKLWRYSQGAWREITDKEQIKAYISDDILQGYEKPSAVFEGMLWLDLKDIASVYNWDKKAETGAVWLDLETAQIRSKYKNFGYDRVTGTGEGCILHYAKNNLTNAEDEGRNIPNLVCAPNKLRGLRFPWQARFEKLSDMLESISEATGIGWDIEVDLYAKNMLFKAIEGRNLADDEGIERIVISLEMGNADDIGLSRVSGNYSNVAYTGGAGEDEERLILAVAEGEISTGKDRRESWTEAGGSEDVELLRMAGLKKLKSEGRKVSIRAEVLDGGAVEYEKDWDIGDIVKVQFKAGGIEAEADLRVNEVLEVVEVDKPRSLRVTFGDSPVTIHSLVRSYGKGVIR